MTETQSQHADPSSNPPHDGERVGFSDPYTRYVMLVLFIVYVVSYIDRQLMAVLLEPIKNDLGVSDTQMGLLTGVAFAIFYATLGMPIARFADRNSRRSVIAAGVAVWSMMTAATGLARNFTQILAARIFVGVGEAAGGAPGHSLISDYFPPRQRATALALYSTGGTVGIMLGMWLGGWIGFHYGWRIAFVVLGIPGVLIALLVRLTVREPVRGRFDEADIEAEPAPPAREAIRYLLSKPSYRWLTLAATLHVFAGFGASNWYASFLIRIHDMPLDQIGLWLGPFSGAAATLGALFFGRLVDRMGSRDARWYMWLPMIGTLCAMPFSYAFILSDSLFPAIYLMLPAAFFGNSYTGATFAMAQGLARPQMRTLSAATVLFSMNLLGMGFGPFVIGLMNDTLGPRFGTEAIRYSLLIIGIPHLVAAVMNALAAKTLRNDLRETA
ncbi:MFS transporter [Myxococcota bacterium]|nr:MFS transporter [Myxococcota bacterium]